jgi:hypothetical protein
MIAALVRAMESAKERLTAVSIKSGTDEGR